VFPLWMACLWRSLLAILHSLFFFLIFPALLDQILHLICIFSFFQIFSSPDPKGHVSYSHHLASVVRPSSVVRRPSYVVNFFKNLLLWKY
jgi:hypothetical protein